MNIYGYIIESTQIVGIGPLFINRSGSHYQIFLFGYAITIESGYMNFIEPMIDEDKKKHQDFQATYEAAKKEIVCMLNKREEQMLSGVPIK